MARKQRVLILAPYAAVRAGLSALVSEDADLEIAGMASGSAELQSLLVGAIPSVILAEPSEDDIIHVLDAAEEAAIGVVLLGEEGGGLRWFAGADLPGWGYLLQDADSAEIAAAVRAVSEGMIVLGAGVRGDLLITAEPTNEAVSRPLDHTHNLLTPRELQDLQLMSSGLPNKVIANRLSVSLHTVKFHVASILAKLGAESRTEAVTVGARRGYVTL